MAFGDVSYEEALHHELERRAYISARGEEFKAMREAAHTQDVRWVTGRRSGDPIYQPFAADVENTRDGLTK